MKALIIKCILAVAMAFCISCGTESDPSGADSDPDETFFSADGKGDSLFSVEEGSAEARGVLRLANEADMATLDDSDKVSLDIRAARHIIAYREQDPDDPDDDQTIDSLVELDSIKWVGVRAFGKLYEYAKNNGYFELVIEAEPISSEGASLDGEILSRAEIRMDLVASEGDRIVVWLRMEGEPEWNPSISIFRQDEARSLVWGNPPGFADAHIPWHEDNLDQGWEVPADDRYRLALNNFSDRDGHFIFELECVAGPCKPLTEEPQHDIDNDGVLDVDDNCIGVANPDQSDSDEDGIGDACAPESGNDPFEDLFDATLEQVLRDENSGHISYSYDVAREYLFGTVENEEGFVECVYTGESIETDHPSDAYSQGFNTEHTWPKSRGADEEPPISDLHHLFPTTVESNQVRSNFHFGEVVGDVIWTHGESEFGDDADGFMRFEPRDDHKGNVARAMFYFAVNYDEDIPAHEEEILRQWHVDDPVDAEERARNEAVFEIQNSRNPFVDWPERVERISDF